ncbi:hypothetical protein PF002_g20051 [Phytophthora fragariae]|uniref:Uncharacterized protein n=1 Tax=Phytophthora fragariae TaxID=53985 RepID=A0A6A3ENK9_9STRA|nr:hypothetical protein PF009_g14945 [Phytophthora fragariae]KAE9206295.1 hypothetical protein PF002_g20051 [Phytophthora fragariae]
MFTLLSLVNNEAFVALTNPLRRSHPARTDEHQTYLPEWKFRLIGTLSPNDAAVMQPQVTWGALFGFPGDPWGYSADFRAAAEKLEAMGVEEKASKACIGDTFQTCGPIEFNSGPASKTIRCRRPSYSAGVCCSWLYYTGSQPGIATISV